MKWRNLKTDPPEHDAKILARYKSWGKEEIKVHKYYKGKKDGSFYTVDGVKHTDYIGGGNGQWQFHNAPEDIYYLLLDELKKLETEQ